MEKRLQEALRMLHGIRKRHELDRSVGCGNEGRYTVHVALGSADMVWIATAIEALEKALAGALEQTIIRTKDVRSPDTLHG